MTLREYVKKRNGVPMGSPNSMRNNLYRSLGAKSFSTFWNYWNPIFGYYLGNKIFRPLKRNFPPAVSLIMTFVFCGLIHDFITLIFKGKTSLFFSVWFLIMSFAVVLNQYLKYDLSNKSWWLRALSNIFTLAITFVIASRIHSFITENLSVRL